MKIPVSMDKINLYPIPYVSSIAIPHSPVTNVDTIQKITLIINNTETLAKIIFLLVIGITLKFLNVSLSRSIKNNIAATIPIIQGSRNCIPYPSIILNSPSKASAEL